MDSQRSTLKSALATVVAVAAVVGLTACEDGTGPAGTGEASVVLKSTDGAASSMVAGLSSGPTVATQDLSLDLVTSISVDVNRVEVLPMGSESSAAGPWVSIDVAVQTVDLTDLGATGVEIAEGDIAAGDYRAVRLFLENATITFSEDVTFAGGSEEQTFVAGEAHPLTIPSSAHTGVKIPQAEFTVEEGATGTVVIEFDPDASVQNVNVSDQGMMMAPVLIAADGSGA